MRRYDDAEFKRLSKKPRVLSDTTIVADDRDEIAVGSVLRLATGAELDAGYRSSVRRLWRPVLGILLVVLLLVFVYAFDIPFRDGLPFWRVLVNALLAAVVLVPVQFGVMHLLTRDADARVTQALGGRMRDDLAAQRREVSA